MASDFDYAGGSGLSGRPANQSIHHSASSAAADIRVDTGRTLPVNATSGEFAPNTKDELSSFAEAATLRAQLIRAGYPSVIVQHIRSLGVDAMKETLAVTQQTVADVDAPYLAHTLRAQTFYEMCLRFGLPNPPAYPQPEQTELNQSTIPRISNPSAIQGGISGNSSTSSASVVLDELRDGVPSENDHQSGFAFRDTSIDASASRRQA